MEYSNDLQDVYKNIEDHNPIKKRKILIVFDDMIADMINNNKLNPVVSELFIRSRKLNISIVFIMQSYFKVPKDVRLNSRHFFIMKIPNKTRKSNTTKTITKRQNKKKAKITNNNLYLKIKKE